MARVRAFSRALFYNIKGDEDRCVCTKAFPFSLLPLLLLLLLLLAVVVLLLLLLLVAVIVAGTQLRPAFWADSAACVADSAAYVADSAAYVQTVADSAACVRLQRDHIGRLLQSVE